MVKLSSRSRCSPAVVYRHLHTDTARVLPSNPPPSTAPATESSQDRRRPEHVPKTGVSKEDKYVLTLHTDPEHAERMTTLRKTNFQRMLVPAHICLFHALPGSQIGKIKADIQSLTKRTRPFAIYTDKAYKFATNNGVGVNVSNVRPVRRLQRSLAKRWSEFLSTQDSRTFRPHYTITSKVSEDEAEEAFQRISEDFQSSTGEVDGLALFKYDNGRWCNEQVFRFHRAVIRDSTQAEG